MITRWLDADWRTIVHQDNALKLRVRRAFSMLNLPSPDRLFRLRYRAQAHEEWVSECLIRNRLAEPPYLADAIKDRIAAIPRDQGILFATVHWGESTVGSAFLGAFGRPTCVMNSRFVESEAVPTALRRHYQSKYRAMNERLKPGLCVATEDGIRPFIRHLHKGGAVAMTVDIPDQTGSAVTEKWFDYQCRLSPGFRHLERRTNSVVIPYVAEYDQGRWCFRFAEDNEPVYDFFSRIIRQCPEKWWAADLFPMAVGFDMHSSTVSDLS